MSRTVPNSVVWIAGAEQSFYDSIAAALALGTLQVQQTSLVSGAEIEVTLNDGILPVLDSRLVVMWPNGVFDTATDLIIDRVSEPNTITITPAPDPGQLPMVITIVAFV